MPFPSITSREDIFSVNQLVDILAAFYLCNISTLHIPSESYLHSLHSHFLRKDSLFFPFMRIHQHAHTFTQRSPSSLLTLRPLLTPFVTDHESACIFDPVLA
jgi:hypothetical protein